MGQWFVTSRHGKQGDVKVARFSSGNNSFLDEGGVERRWTK